MRNYKLGCRLVSLPNLILCASCLPLKTSSNANSYLSCVNVDKDNAKCDCRGISGSLPASVRKIASAKTKYIHTPLSKGEEIKGPVCKPGDFMCIPNGMNGIVVCNSDGQWRLSATCGGDNSCQNRATPGTAYCLWELNSIDTVTLAPDVSRDLVLQQVPCGPPGSYACGLDHGSVWICGPDGVWQLSSLCCGRDSCVDGPTHGTAHCTCRKEELSIEPAKNETSIAPPNQITRIFIMDKSNRTVEARQDCDPGTYGCAHGDNDMLATCKADGTWTLSNMCCGPSSCVVGPGYGDAHCSCRRKPRSLEPLIFSFDPNKGPNDPDEPELCTPGRYTCGDLSSKIYVCNFKGNWELSAICGSGTICQRGQHHEAYCMVTVQGTVDSTALPPRSVFAETPIVAALDSDVSAPQTELREETARCGYCRLAGHTCVFTGSIRCAGIRSCPEPANQIRHCLKTEATADGQEIPRHALLARSLSATTPNVDELASDIPAHRLDNNKFTTTFTPGRWGCCHAGEYICICNSLGEVQISAWCGGKHRCSDVMNGQPYCTGGTKAILDEQELLHPTLPVRSLELAHMDFAPTKHTSTPHPSDDNAGGTCTPGTYRCCYNEGFISVCNSLGVWQDSADCGGIKLCHIGADGQPYCGIEGAIGPNEKATTLLTNS
jgi:hypothetical protein